MFSGKRSEEKTYEQFMEEALLQIPLYTPEWTNYNLSDPGITIIENLSAFAVLQQNMMKQQTVQMTEALYGLAGFSRRPGSYARVLLSAEQVPEECILPAGQQFRVGDLIFESEKAVLLSGAHLTSVCLEDAGGKFIDCSDVIKKEKGFPVSIFSEKPEKGMRLYLFFHELPAEEENFIFYIKVHQRYHRNKKNQDGQNPGFAKIQWQCFTRQGFQNITVEDETDNFLFDGKMTFHLRGVNPAVWKTNGIEGYVFCGVLERAEYDIPPQISEISGFLFEVSQKETKSMVKIFRDTDSISFYHDILEQEYFKLYVKGDEEEEWHLCGKEDYETVHDGFGMYTFLFPEKMENIMLTAYTEEVMYSYHLGTVYGYDGEQMELPAKNVAPEECSVIAEKKNRETGEVLYYHLFQGEDDGTGFSYQIEEETGILKILEGGKLHGCELYLGNFVTFQGNQGNVLPGKEFYPQSYRTEIRFFNPAPGLGGKYRETLEELEKRFLKDVHEVHTAVTDKDYENIVKKVPYLCIDKVRAYRDAENDVVHIAVKPDSPKKQPRLSARYKRMISGVLEEKRMMNTIFILEQPVYLPVHVYGKIFVKDNYAGAKTQIENVIIKHLDYLQSEKNFGEVLKFDKVFEAVENLECVEAIGDFHIRPGALSCAVLEGADIRPDNNCLIYPGDIRIDLDSGNFQMQDKRR